MFVFGRLSYWVWPLAVFFKTFIIEYSGPLLPFAVHVADNKVFTLAEFLNCLCKCAVFF